ncbi:guanosine-3',5'-bis(diphosphate) 3'-pyrophosphohydrolase [Pasteurella skyensis]|uniref:Guanosine-3',5'-bis(Diphosphate) 3'-pyrophosphohydrolase n=1 Tax=Phocoenobacter skyensis TaxID=97481 RepID=A0AAJ6N9U3_9PAST|nr:guanosine-3',5'-bis(diphosphate) 3'-pyrophosphohydrolase [Pasteurella skyensis]MDP8162561.1 guanosine-3',5'-bis(diphosphate) 3'-pyrophosphohydrolase [Pasteurella skyensis]MDP8172841.1 guanosine-3',5'-bis(diphosphate) 3'-pyrophosphohydrolase [Pasteurella skyensis]MDP8177315.1 guanosine-3',5'-bis(diphosphate) 3'-pyrophosphohydrolase [Pasteurella skyensis]MDP8179242.1 guanosine-3',5'-bis(diphosphate) 3'-pyrophosphohydrolase [Pasteurella skyensis]MDP8183511.1 guanosine-3',5'-bis(diphosphate) 3'
MKLLRAFLIALNAHKGQFDKAGKPYITHPIRVMFGVKGYKEKIVALLHDVVEDSDYTLRYLENYFDKDIIKAVDLVTKKEAQEYREYLSQLKENKISKAVKLSDLRDNMNLKRIKNITQKDLDRLEKYKKATAYLEGRANALS